MPGDVEVVHGGLVLIDPGNSDMAGLSQMNEDRPGTRRPGRAQFMGLGQRRERDDRTASDSFRRIMAAASDLGTEDRGALIKECLDDCG
jgi:hypothetical protein